MSGNFRGEALFFRSAKTFQVKVYKNEQMQGMINSAYLETSCLHKRKKKKDQESKSLGVSVASFLHEQKKKKCLRWCQRKFGQF